MNLDQAFSRVAVVGAAGKMGSGISLLLLQEMAKKELAAFGRVGSPAHKLTLIDSNRMAISGLHAYLRSQMLKFAEKNINALRKGYAKDPHLVSNEEMIQAYVEGAMELINSGTDLKEANGAYLLFEAIVEDVEAKCAVYQAFASVASHPFYIFTNTSSIPISVLNAQANLQNHIIGFHFYNPPAIQKLVELIPLESGDPLLADWATDFAKRLNKIVVKSKDIAGFIGNGYFLREIVFACAKVRDLSVIYSLSEAIDMINTVTQDFLLRPMGIFQLLDYVGLDVAKKIGKIMDTYLAEGVYESGLVDALVKEGIMGGQFADGSQKNGFYHYTDGKPDGIYMIDEKRYLLFDEGDWKKRCQQALGGLPKPAISWKELQKDPQRKMKIQHHIDTILKENTLGAELAQAFLMRSREIIRSLVNEGVAEGMEEVATVLENGFFHLYTAEEVLPKEWACAG